ncbi:hypothetical protein OWR29_25855 [Actinoplanes sp. Pm04-4]|uniref:Uncharacterized protein n=1 Tax=Paractinoplanes pyxinae TaxID=2997416 RepID=A0ABT4B4N1_9ACTN|nr:hypothetical protein [Actinoplanes pyxinae]MCY1141436.1 hypothetical protein [Actinoplanes pyxinae]
MIDPPAARLPHGATPNRRRIRGRHTASAGQLRHRALQRALQTYFWIDPSRHRHPVRHRWEPAADIHQLHQEQLSELPVGYLRTELDERLTRGPAQFDLQVQLADPVDPINDPTVSWPSQRLNLHRPAICLEPQ